jgi:hypothetical protein
MGFKKTVFFEISTLYGRNTLLPVMKMGVIALCSKKVSKPNAHFFNYLVGLLGI